jgi:simple sugar transport system substrate-binding protein
MIRRNFLKGATALCSLPLLASPVRAADKLKVGFVYTGPIGDFGWSYQHDVARKAVDKALGDRVETVYVENVAEGPDAERTIEGLVRDGSKLVFTTSFGFMEPTIKVASRHPEVKFEHATGYKRTANVATYSARFYEGRYVIGQIAGKMSKSGVVGYVASFPIPEVISGINSFMLGAWSVRPDMKLKVVWVSSWFDPGKEADAAKALIDQGADIITQHTDSPAAIQISEQRGIKCFGQDSDMINFGPKSQLSAIIDHWSDYYVERTRAVLDGSWKSGDVWGRLGTMVQMAPFTNMPDDVLSMAKTTTAAISAGSLHPFHGPLAKQDGTPVVKQGEVLADGDILGMNWYVKGIDEKPPQ